MNYGPIELVVYAIQGQPGPFFLILFIFSVFITASVIAPKHVQITSYYPPTRYLRRIPAMACKIIKSTKHIPKHLRRRLIHKKARPKKQPTKKPTMDTGDNKQLTHNPFKKALCHPFKKAIQFYYIHDGPGWPKSKIR
jgi:hypothetical protein